MCVCVCVSVCVCVCVGVGVVDLYFSIFALVCSTRREEEEGEREGG